MKKNEIGLYTLSKSHCTVLMLKKILFDHKYYVYIQNHFPNKYIEWWTIKFPITKGGKSKKMTVRLIRFDIQMSVKEFLDSIEDFEYGGIDFFLMKEKMPNTLIPEYIEEPQRTQVMIKNGMILKFILPHENEVGVFSSPDKAILEKIEEITK